MSISSKHISSQNQTPNHLKFSTIKTPKPTWLEILVYSTRSPRVQTLKKKKQNQNHRENWTQFKQQLFETVKKTQAHQLTIQHIEWVNSRKLPLKHYSTLAERRERIWRERFYGDERASIWVLAKCLRVSNVNLTRIYRPTVLNPQIYLRCCGARVWSGGCWVLFRRISTVDFVFVSWGCGSDRYQ